MPHHVQTLISSLTPRKICPEHQMESAQLRASILKPCWLPQKPSVRRAAQSEACQQLAAALEANQELRDEISELREALAAAAMLPQMPAGGFSSSLPMAM